jgi:hypothetical protein
MTNLAVARRSERACAVTRQPSKPRRVHFQLVDVNGCFAACGPHLVTDVPLRGLTHHTALVNCAACRTVIARALRLMEVK